MLDKIVQNVYNFPEAEIMARKRSIRPDLSPRELAEAIGVSESSVKRWADDGRLSAPRTAGGHRRIPRAEAVRFVRAGGLRVVRPELLGFPGAAGGGDEEALTAALTAGDAARALGMIAGWFLAGRSLPAIFDGPVRGAMHAIGRLWRCSDDGVFVEHRATDICVQAVTQVRLALPPAAARAPSAVGGAPSGDPYLMGSAMAAAALRDVGLRAVNLGPDTPNDSLRAAIARHRPRLVWLSLSSRTAAPAAAEDLPVLAEEVSAGGAVLVVGGQAALGALGGPVPEPMVLAETMAELAALAHGLLAGPR